MTEDREPYGEEPAEETQDIETIHKEVAQRLSKAQQGLVGILGLMQHTMESPDLLEMGAQLSEIADLFLLAGAVDYGRDLKFARERIAELEHELNGDDKCVACSQWVVSGEGRYDESGVICAKCLPEDELTQPSPETSP